MDRVGHIRRKGETMVQSRRERLDRQRERQRDYRAEMKAKRKPSRDDIARTLLHFVIARSLQRGTENELYRFQSEIVKNLVDQGFDRKACNVAFDDLIEKYRSGWAFQRKLQLLSKGDKKGEEG